MKVDNAPDMSILVSSIEKYKKGKMSKKVSVFLDKNAKIDLDVSAFQVVNTLPSVSDAKEGMFYILPDDSLNFVSSGAWHSISGGGGGGGVVILRGEGNPAMLGVEAEAGTFYEDSSDQKLYFMVDEWAEVKTQQANTSYGNIHFYSKWNFALNLEYEDNCVVENWDEDKLLEFLGGQVPEWGINFNYEEVWDEETGEPTGEYAWRYYDEFGERIIYQDEMLATTGIEVSMKPETEWATIEFSGSMKIDTESEELYGYLMDFESLRFDSPDSFSSGLIYYYDEETEKYKSMQIPAGSVTQVSLWNEGTEEAKATSYGCCAYCQNLRSASVSGKIILGSYNFAFCGSLQEFHGSGVVKTGDYCLTQCTSLSRVYGFSNLEEAGSGFMSSCSAFNSDLDFSKLKKIGSAFLNGCSSFNKPLNLSSATEIGNSFLSGCLVFNNTLTLNPMATLDGQSFMSGCANFSHELSLPQNVTSWYMFMYNCKEATTVDLGNLKSNIISTYDSNSRRWIFSTDSSSSTAYQDGLTLTGAYVDDFISLLPNRSSSPYRKLINGGGGISITVDDHLDNASENPVQNKVITNSITQINNTIGDVESILNRLNSGAGINEES